MKWCCKCRILMLSVPEALISNIWGKGVQERIRNKNERMNARSLRERENKAKNNVKRDSRVCHASVSSPVLLVPDW